MLLQPKLLMKQNHGDLRVSEENHLCSSPSKYIQTISIKKHPVYVAGGSWQVTAHHPLLLTEELIGCNGAFHTDTTKLQRNMKLKDSSYNLWQSKPVFDLFSGTIYQMFVKDAIWWHLADDIQTKKRRETPEPTEWARNKELWCSSIFLPLFSPVRQLTNEEWLINGFKCNEENKEKLHSIGEIVDICFSSSLLHWSELTLILHAESARKPLTRAV